jgi:uncharacterized surface protein with fasciclin (FAS1) repeats
MAVSFIGGGNRSTRRKTTNLSQVIDKLYHITLYRVLVNLHLSDSRFSELMQLIKIAEIGDQLEENGPFTVFAPTNDVNNIFYFSFYSESGSSWS